MKISRNFITLGTILVLVVALIYAFWPNPTLVDVGLVGNNPMIVTIAEEGKTQVHEAYIVSTPVAGKLLRVNFEAGDKVVGGESIIGSILPIRPSLLDARDIKQAQANVSAAQAALVLAKADLDKAVADQQLADIQLQRMEKLFEVGAISKAELDKSVNVASTSGAVVRNANAAIAVREAELVAARAPLGNYNGAGQLEDVIGAEISILAPVTGRVLRVMQKSESTLPAGAAIMEIGNVESNLEVLVELLSSDAVQVSLGNRVIIKDWGGAEELQGVVQRIEPRGFTKVSALGVDEQRVNVIVKFVDPPENFKKIGHGFRIQAEIVIWEENNVLVVPSSALFRIGKEWNVFIITNGKAKIRRVGIGRNNGIEAQVTEGLDSGDQVVLYPSSSLTDGTKVSNRTGNR